MLTREEIEQWHNPPCTEQAKWLLRLANQFFNTPSGNKEHGSSSDTGRLVRNTPIRRSIIVEERTGYPTSPETPRPDTM
jgi:hypothetical protein